MNNDRRYKLRRAVQLLKDAEMIMDSVLDAESDALDNIPENLQSSDKYDRIENAVSSLEDAIEGLGDVQSSVEAAILC